MEEVVVTGNYSGSEFDPNYQMQLMQQWAAAEQVATAIPSGISQTETPMEEVIVTGKSGQAAAPFNLFQFGTALSGLTAIPVPRPTRRAPTRRTKPAPTRRRTPTRKPGLPNSIPRWPKGDPLNPYPTPGTLDIFRAKGLPGLLRRPLFFFTPNEVASQEFENAILDRGIRPVAPIADVDSDRRSLVANDPRGLPEFGLSPDEVTVTGRRLAPSPAPEYAPELAPIPNLEFRPIPEPVPDARNAPKNEPVSKPSPGFDLPSLPNSFPGPLNSLFSLPVSLPVQQPVPKEDLDKCNCKSKEQKKKKKKKSRDDCFEYKVIQYSNGTKQYNKKKIPCETKPARKPSLKKFTKGFPKASSLLNLGV